METRAAIAWKAGDPLRIERVNLEGPREGEVLVEIKATGVCHTDAFTLSGEDPEGLRALVSAPVVPANRAPVRALNAGWSAVQRLGVARPVLTQDSLVRSARKQARLEGLGDDFDQL